MCVAHEENKRSLRLRMEKEKYMTEDELDEGGGKAFS